MPVERSRLEADLRGLVQGEVLTNPVFRQIYASDASLFQQTPLAVVRPRSVEDVSATISYAAEHRLSVHARGAGSGVAGESLGSGIMIDFSRAMRRWRFEEGGRIRVESGVVLAQLNRELAAVGRMYGPDPAMRSVTTMGSVLAVDASGSHWPRYGSAARTVVSLQVVLSDGQVLELGQHRADEPGPAGRLAAGVMAIQQRYASSLAGYRCRALLQRGGYPLTAAVNPPFVNLARLLTGSEGTLALITAATLETDPIPEHRGVMLLFFERLEHAAQAAGIAGTAEASACDLIDRRLLEISRESDARYEPVVPRSAEAMLLIEMQGQSIAAVRDLLESLAEQIQEQLPLVVAPRITTTPRERDFLWRLSRRVTPRLYRLKGRTRPLAFVEDMAVAPADLPAFLFDVQDVLKRQHVTASFYVHASHGQIHLRPFLDQEDPHDLRRMIGLAEELYELVLHYEGTISGEHGTGLSRSWYLPRQFGPAWPAMVEIKELFDPAGLFHPQHVTGASAMALAEHHRPVALGVACATPHVAGESKASVGFQATDLPVLNLAQVWPESDTVELVAKSCNGCGRCRTTGDDSRMCPMFRALPGEEASPRAKANLFRGVLSGELELSQLASREAYDVASLCFGCQQCRLDCPANVDIPKLATEIKAQYVATNGLQLSQLWLTRLDLFAGLASRFPRTANALLRNQRARWLIERLLGVTQRRPLPPLAAKGFLRWAGRRRLTRSHRQAIPKVAYFVDYFATWHDVELAQAIVGLFRHNGYEVFVPPSQSQSWMAKIAVGDLEKARRGAAKNVKILADAVRQGYQIVTSEPSAALCLQREYRHLLGNEDAELVAQNSHDAGAFLWELHRRNGLKLDLQPVSATLAYHQPCHLRAIPGGDSGPALLRLIPGLQVKRIEAGCSGMAGLYGLHRDHYRTSLRVGWPMITAFRKDESTWAASECTACRMQLEHGAHKATVHPLKVLAHAYGLLPSLQLQPPE